MPTAAPKLEVRDVEVRAAVQEDGAREFSGIAVPYDAPVTIRDWFGTYTEQIAPGAVEHADDVKVFWRHGEVIGRVVSDEDTDAGWKPTGALSDTTLGRDAYALLKDGAIDRMSIGFEPIEHTEHEDDQGNVTITRTRIRVREVSLVPFPAYDGAAVEHVRNDHQKENTMPNAENAAVLTREQFRDWTQQMEDVTRRLDVVTERMESRDESGDELTPQFRSPGALLKAMVSGDEDAVREYTEVHKRLWDPVGTTTGDTVTKDAWVGDFTRLVEDKATLRNLFASGTLPSTGNNIEFGVLGSDTTSVTEQSGEGEDLAFGKVTITTDTAPVGTFGGYTRLSRQAIERSSINTLDHHLRALTLAANRRRNIKFRAHVAAAVSAQRTADNVVEVPESGATYVDWVSGIVDAAEKFEDLGLDIDGLITGKAGFLELAGLTGTDGRPLMTVYGSGTNVVGELSPKALNGNLAGVQVVLNLKQATAGMSFYNHLAIRDYASPLARLQDGNVINLSEDYSVYYYEAIANEIPAAIVPVRRSTAG